MRLREIIAYELEAESEAIFGDEIEVDESYFGGKRKANVGGAQTGKTDFEAILVYDVSRWGRFQDLEIPEYATSVLSKHFDLWKKTSDDSDQ